MKSGLHIIVSLSVLSLLHSVFENALAAAGWDWHSDRLWDLYAEWEKEQGDLRAMTAVYDRVMRVPTQLYSTHYEKYVSSCEEGFKRVVYTAVHFETQIRIQSHRFVRTCWYFFSLSYLVIFFPPSYIDAAEFITQSLIGKLSNTCNSALQNSDLQNITILFLSFAFTVHKKMSVVLENLKADVNDSVSVPTDSRLI